MAFLNRVDRWLKALTLALVVLTLTSMCALVLSLVIGRMVGASFFWGDELARYTMIYMIFFGAALAFRDDLHPRLTLLQMFTPPWVHRILQGIVTMGVLVVLAVLFVQGMGLAMNEGRMNTPAMNIKYHWLYGVMPAGSILMALTLLLGLVVPRQAAKSVGTDGSSAPRTDTSAASMTTPLSASSTPSADIPPAKTGPTSARQEP